MYRGCNYTSSIHNWRHIAPESPHIWLEICALDKLKCDCFAICITCGNILFP